MSVPKIVEITYAMYQELSDPRYDCARNIHANPRNLESGRHLYETTFFLFIYLFLEITHLFNTITLHQGQELPTLLTILIVDIKSRRFGYQSRRAGDEAKKCKSPAKSRRVGISEGICRIKI